MKYRNLNKYIEHKKSMKRIGALTLLILGLVLMSGFCIAENETNTSSNVATNETISASENLEGIEKGFECLINRVKSDCSGANTIQEISFVIMASHPSLTSGCVTKLKNLEKNNCFGSSACSIKETAMATIALQHVGEPTEKYVNWLKNQTMMSTDLIWYLQQNSEGTTTCRIGYNSQLYDFVAGENKKLNVPAGPCLSLTQSNYWYMVSPSCYDYNFTISCEKEFLATLMYKQPSSSVINILSDTQTAQASQQINLKIKSLCFGTGVCDYESSAWATLALKKTGQTVVDYLPYLIANSESNKQYLPNAFLHMFVDYRNYGSKLIEEQQIGYWEAEGTAYNKFYDTALALLALEMSNQQQVITAKDSLKNMGQDADGCWNNNVRDTAFVLWAMERRSSPVVPVIIDNLCTDAGHFCIASTSCPYEERLINFRCNVGTCCRTNNIKTCSELGGQVCLSGTQCKGVTEITSDTSVCCTSECIPIETQTECESSRGVCRSTCSTTQEEIDYDCDNSALVCCKTKQVEEKGSLWWLWVLLVILIILIILAIIYRDKIKVWIYKKKSGYKEGSQNQGNGRFPPSGPSGMNPMNRPPMVRPGFRPLPTTQSAMRGPARPIPLNIQRRPMPSP